MSRFPEALAFAAVAALAASAAAAGEFGLGRPATEAEIAAWDIDVRPDGAGLPAGQGSVAEGEEVFTERCAMCHGDFGEGIGRWPVLAGGHGSLTRERPIKTIGSYWPYLSTVYDYVHRAMPFGDAQSLTADETYALTAYLLYLNDVVRDDEFVLSRDNFDEVHLPNEGGFVDDPRPDTPSEADAEPCMENCRDSVEIAMRAAVLDVTPEDGDAAGATVSEDGSVSTHSDGDTVAGASGVDDRAGPATDAGSDSNAGAMAAASSDAVAMEAHPEVVEAGEAVFRKCKACHQVGEDATNGVGPELNALFGRTAGAVDGFSYSDAMSAKGDEGLVWTPETLDAFLSDPKGFLPGTKMTFAGLQSAEDRAAVAAYLSQFR